MSKKDSDAYSRLKATLTIPLVIICIAFSWVGTIDKSADKYIDDAIVSATIAYGSARALNATISVAQSAEIGINIGGGASIHPFEILDPVNDMVEDYATVMKFSISSLLIQKILVGIQGNSIFKWLVLGCGSILIIGLIFFNGKFLTLPFKCFVFVSLIRFMFVIAIFLSSWIDASYLHKQTSEKVKLINQAAQEVELINTINGETDEISPEMLKKIGQEIRKEQTKKSSLIEKIQVQKEVFSRVSQNVQEAKEKLKRSGSIFERWNPLNKDESINNAEDSLAKAEQIYSNEDQTLENLNIQLTDTKEELSKLKEALSGKSSFISKVKNIYNSATASLNLQQIEQSLKDSIDTMLYLIAIFVLKTILMPLTFLYFTICIFKEIWGIDPREFFKKRAI